jgi:hypothetical protein
MTMKKMRYITIAGLLTIGLAGCDTDPGPAERAGEEVDEMMQETEEQLQQAAEEAGESIEEAGDQIRDQTEQ